MELTEFVSARLDEWAAWTLTAECSCEDGQPQKPDCPAAVLAVVEAHRKIVALHRALVIDSDSTLCAYGALQTGHVLSALASIWADHPDFDPEWAV